MGSKQSIEIGNIVDRLADDHMRQQIVEATRQLVEVYIATGAATSPLVELRRRYREAHPEEPPPPAMAGAGAQVISLAERRQSAG